MTTTTCIPPIIILENTQIEEHPKIVQDIPRTDTAYTVVEGNQVEYEVIDCYMMGNVKVVIERPRLDEVEKQARMKLAARQMKRVLEEYKEVD